MSNSMYKPPAVVLLNPKYPHNVASAIRACSCFGVSSLLWTGDRVKPEEYERLPREERMKGYRDVSWERTEKPMNRIVGAHTPVCIEIVENASNLITFEHPENAVYIFGPEDGGVSQVYRRMCHHFIFIPSHHCLNLSAALNVVLYDRRAKRSLEGKESIILGDLLKEDRGEIAMPGWEGK